MLVASLLQPFHFRGKARLLHSLCPQTGTQEARIFGYRMSLDLENYIERSIYLHVFEPQESALVRAYLRPAMTVVDVGANVGYYSLMASSLIGKAGHVYAFEPSPYAVNKLRQTIQQNRITNIKVVESALGDEEGMAGIYLSESRENHTPSMVEREGATATPISITTLDAFLERHGIQSVDLLKIDIEGFEPNALRGAQASLAAGRIAAILCEFNEHWLTLNHSSSTELFSTLLSFGFRPSGCSYQADATLQNLLLVNHHTTN